MGALATKGGLAGMAYDRIKNGKGPGGSLGLAGELFNRKRSAGAALLTNPPAQKL